MFQVVVTPPSSEPSSTTSSQASSPRHSLSLSPSLAVHYAGGNPDGLSASALALARDADRSLRLGHTARPGPPVPPPSARSLSPSCAPQRPPLLPTTPSVESSPVPVVSVTPATPRSSLSRATRPSPLSSLLFSSPPPVSSPPSPRTLNSPSYRHPSKLFPSLHTDQRGYLLPPIANPDLPRTLEGPDSFWVESPTIRQAEAQRRKGRGGRGVRRGREQGEKEREGKGDGCDASGPRKEEVKEEEGGEEEVVDVIRVDDEDDELHWTEVLDAVLHVGQAWAVEKQRAIMTRRRKGKQSRTSLTIEPETVEPQTDEPQ